MRRFRSPRGRRAAIALPALAAVTTTTMLATAFAATPASSDDARIAASAGSVRYGNTVALRGTFPGAADARLAILHRPSGSQAWRQVRNARTGADGRYATRVEPRQSGYWRAELAGDSRAPQTTDTGESSATTAAASSGGARITVRSRTRASIAGRHASAGDIVKVRGKVTPAGAERRVVVSIGGTRQTVTAGADGRFAVRWQARSTGSYPVRVTARPNQVAAGSRERAGRVTVYRPAVASWYGPGLYGNPTACGGTLTPSTLGVAHKTMPCGTRLRLRYGGRTVSVRVIDRGPFAGDREFDLTAATKQRLGFPDTGTVLSSK